MSVIRKQQITVPSGAPRVRYADAGGDEAVGQVRPMERHHLGWAQQGAGAVVSFVSNEEKSAM